eukprot:scaffold17703_cov119-Isochrysis_galbana.AAC.8
MSEFGRVIGTPPVGSSRAVDMDMSVGGEVVRCVGTSSVSGIPARTGVSTFPRAVRRAVIRSRRIPWSHCVASGLAVDEVHGFGPGYVVQVRLMHVAL